MEEAGKIHEKEKKLLEFIRELQYGEVTILDEFCKKHCPNSDEREFFEKYGRKCPNCYPESYHYWLIQRYGKTE